MKLTPLGIEGAWVAESPVWSDERGFFREWFKLEDIRSATGLDFSVAQSNISQSKRGVVRGIHYSLAKEGQAKWVTCVSGNIRDVVVDIRQPSPTFGKSVFVDLDTAGGKSVLIGPGLGHGFSVMSEDAVVSYLLTSSYVPKFEQGICPLDDDLNIDWSLSQSEIILSEKDKNAESWKEYINHQQKVIDSKELQ